MRRAASACMAQMTASATRVNRSAKVGRRNSRAEALAGRAREEGRIGFSSKQEGKQSCIRRSDSGGRGYEHTTTVSGAGRAAVGRKCAVRAKGASTYSGKV